MHQILYWSKFLSGYEWSLGHARCKLLSKSNMRKNVEIRSIFYCSLVIYIGISKYYISHRPNFPRRRESQHNSDINWTFNSKTRIIYLELKEAEEWKFRKNLCKYVMEATKLQSSEYVQLNWILRITYAVHADQPCCLLIKSQRKITNNGSSDSDGMEDGIHCGFMYFFVAKAKRRHLWVL